MLYGSQAFNTILAAVRDALTVAMGNTIGGAPKRIGIVPGAIAWDDCDTCGLLALSLVRTYLSDDFPIESAAPMSVSGTQGALLCADFAVQSIRCAPLAQGNALSPDVDALEASAQIVNADAYTLECTTLNTLMTMMHSDDIADFLMRPLTTVGPEGACVGCELGFTVAVIR